MIKKSLSQRKQHKWYRFIVFIDTIETANGISSEVNKGPCSWTNNIETNILCLLFLRPLLQLIFPLGPSACLYFSSFDIMSSSLFLHTNLSHRKDNIPWTYTESIHTIYFISRLTKSAVSCYSAVLNQALQFCRNNKQMSSNGVAELTTNFFFPADFTKKISIVITK